MDTNWFCKSHIQYRSFSERFPKVLFTCGSSNFTDLSGFAFDSKEQYNTVCRWIPFFASLWADPARVKASTVFLLRSFWADSAHVKALTAFSFQSFVLSCLFAASFQGLRFVSPKSLFLLWVVQLNHLYCDWNQLLPWPGKLWPKGHQPQ